MKKIFYTLFFVTSLFIFNNKINAEQYKDMHDFSYACYYESDTVDFAVIYRYGGLYDDVTHDVKLIPISEEFEINGSKLTNENVWSKNQLQVYGEDRNLTSKDKCYNYMYFDQVTENWWTGFWSGNTADDKIYFSDDYVKIDGVDLILTLASYQDSPENAVLDELFCTYSPTSDEIADHSLVDLDILSFKITSGAEKGIGTYEVFDDLTYPLYERDINKSTDTITYFRYGTEYTVKDNFHIRLFYDEATGQWTCPEKVFMGYSDKIAFGVDSKITYEIEYLRENLAGYEKENFSDKDRTVVTYFLNTDASYLYYEKMPANQSQICTFSKENEEDWSLSIAEYTYTNGNTTYEAFKKNNSVKISDVNIEIPSGAISEGCSGLTTIYTDCLSNKSCKISTEYFSGSIKLQSNEKLNSEDASTVLSDINYLTGEKYKQLICALKPRLSAFSTNSDLRKTTSLDIYNSKSKHEGSYNVLDLPCDKWSAEYTFDCTDEKCKNNLEYAVNKQIREILYYCQDTYKNYFALNSDTDLRIGRYKECETFNKFYDSLVANGIISSLTEGCDILSYEFKDKLNLYLNIIKIAAPILAIVLGMLDFTKVLVAGDADKEMKDAWKKFKIRLMAAALLFLVPVLLSTLLNVFIGDDIDNNPYCSLFDTEYKH